MAKSQHSDIPAGMLFAETHEYVLWDEGEDRVRVGISQYATEQLGDVVYVEMPEIGEKFEAGDTFGTIESVKAASDLYMPITGEILAINTQLATEPELINDNCYGDGWLLEILMADSTALKSLMTAEQYLKMLEEAVNL